MLTDIWDVPCVCVCVCWCVALKNTTDTNIVVRISWHVQKYLGVKILDHRLCYYLAIQENVQLFSKVDCTDLHSLAKHIEVHEGTSCSLFLPTLVIFPICHFHSCRNTNCGTASGTFPSGLVQLSTCVQDSLTLGCFLL